MIVLKIISERNKKIIPLEFDKPFITIGRKKSNDVFLNNTNVSRVHAKITQKDDQWYIVDNNSSNGTFLNSKQVNGDVENPLKKNDCISIVNFRIEVVDILENSEPEIVATDKSRFYRDPDIIKLKEKIHKQLLEIIDLRCIDLKNTSDDDLRRQCDEIVRRIIKELQNEIPSDISQEEFIKDILDEVLELGPLQELLDDNSITEIMVNRSDQIYVEKKNKGVILSPKIFSSNQSLMGAISRIVAPIGRRVDESSPMVDARLKKGHRVNVIIPPLTIKGPCITIRKFPDKPLTIQELLNYQTLNKQMADFIKYAVQSKKNIIVSGGTGSGKTTLLNIISSFIPENERIVTIEDAAELRLNQNHVISLESRPSNIEGKGAIPIRELVKNSLRMRPDRIVVGECRGGEALDMLQAMNTGHDGSLTTAHANSPRDMISRLETMVLMSGEDLPVKAIRKQVASAVDFIIQQNRFSCGVRKITHISEITGIEDDEIMLQDIFYFKQKEMDSEGKTTGNFMATGWIPEFLEDLNKKGFSVDMGIFHN